MFQMGIIRGTYIASNVIDFSLQGILDITDSD